MIAVPSSPSFAANLSKKEEPRTAHGSVHDATRSPISILIVDDSRDKLLALETVLHDLQQNVVCVNSGSEALRVLLRQEFAVILLDVNMPSMDGFETAQLIRQRKATEHVPIIFVTSFSTADTEVFRGYSLGAVDYIFTPVVPDVLRAKVNVFIALSQQKREIQHQAEQLRQLQEERHIRQLTEAAERIEWETRRNRFFNLSIELLAIVDYRGQFVQANPTWLGVLGFEQDELRSERLLELVHADDRPTIEAEIHKLNCANEPGYFECRVRTKAGGYRWLGWTLAPFAAEQLLYVFARDITERIEREAEILQLNRTLEKHAADLQSANRELEEFSYSISHDLRGPLRAITGYAEILLEEYAKEFSDESRQMVDAVNRNSGHLTKLIDDFLAFFRFGRTQVNVLPFDMRALAMTAIDVVRPVNTGRQIEFKVGVLPAAYGDRAMLRQVLINLLSNAVKFTARAPVAHIEIGAEQNAQRGTIYYVRDNGVGFNMKYYDKLFGVFQSLHKDEGFDGTGIGLALVYKIIRRHGGEIWAEGKEGEGATFYFTLGEKAE